MTLGLRRILVFVLSIIGGIAGVYVIFAGLNAFYRANVDFARYGALFFVLTAIPLALLVGVWMDYFMRTGIIPEVGEPTAKPERRGRSAEAEE